jgi:hypothetical protein
VGFVAEVGVICHLAVGNSHLSLCGSVAAMLAITNEHDNRQMKNEKIRKVLPLPIYRLPTAAAEVAK